MSTLYRLAGMVVALRTAPGGPKPVNRRHGRSMFCKLRLWKVTSCLPDMPLVYQEPGDDDMLTVRRGDLHAVLDIATESLDIGCEMLDTEQVEILRKVAEIVGVDPVLVTPPHF